MDSDKLVMELSTYNSYSLYCLLTARYIDMGLLTSHRVLLSDIAGYSITYCFFNVCSGSYSLWLQLQRRGGLPGVCVGAVSQPGAHWMKCPSFGSIRIQSHQAEVCVELSLAVVEKVRKMITKCGKS